MPRVSPGVDITITDKSQLILTNNSVLFGAIGEFSRGMTTPTLITNRDELTKYFGSYGDTPSTGKKAYVGISNILNSATGIYVANVLGASGTLYGGQTVESSNLRSVIAGQSVNTDYIFTAVGTGTVTTEVVGTGTAGGLLIFTYYTKQAVPMVPGTVVVTATIGGTLYTFTDNTVGKFLDVTGTQINTTNSYVHYNTGKIYIEFKAGKAPDSGIDINANWTNYGIGAGVKKTVTNEVASVPGKGALVLTYDFNLAHFPLIAYLAANDVVTLGFTTVDGAQSISDDGVGGWVGGTQLETSSTINYETGAIHLVCKAAKGIYAVAPILISYKYCEVELFVIYGISPKAWVNNYGITISSVNQTDNTFYINEYSKDSTGAVTFIQSYLVSRRSGAVDGFGNNIYIEDVVAAKSNYFVCFDNSAVAGAILPTNNTTVTYCGGGADGTAATATERVTAINLFDDVQYSWDIFVGNGMYDVTELTAISDMVTNQEKFAFVDAKDETAANIKTWAMSTIAINNSKMAMYSPNANVSYQGLTVPIAPSALVAERYAASVANGQKFMSPVGVERGTVTVTSLDRYWNDANILDLHEANVNDIKFIRGYGNVIFGDFTMQTATTSISYINSVLTLNDMLHTFRNSLITINFKVINEITFLELRSLVDSYLNRLALQNGTIEPGYTVTCDSTNNTVATKDAREIHCDVIFVFQGLVQNVKLQLTYTTNALYAQLV